MSFLSKFVYPLCVFNKIRCWEYYVFPSVTDVFIWLDIEYCVFHSVCNWVTGKLFYNLVYIIGYAASLNNSNLLNLWLEGQLHNFEVFLFPIYMWLYYDRLLMIILWDLLQWYFFCANCRERNLLLIDKGHSRITRLCSSL